MATPLTTLTRLPLLPSPPRVFDAVRVWIGAQLQQQQQQEATKAAGPMMMATRLEGVDEGLRRMLDTANLDHVAERRLLREAFKDVQLGIDHCLFTAGYTGVQFEESYECSFNIIAYKDKPRLRTALELLRTTQELERKLGEVSLPLFILHGEADIVTDPSISKALYEKASSLDKSIRLYQDAYHSILEGESDEMIFEALGDIISWLDAHSDSKVSN